MKWFSSLRLSQLLPPKFPTHGRLPAQASASKSPTCGEFRALPGFTIAANYLYRTSAILGIISICLFWCAPVWAGQLVDRVAAFPNWTEKPNVERATSDLNYPNWIAGTWRVKSTLVDLVAPLAPEIVTPGFESNRALLNQAIAFNVRFIPKNKEVIADRAFNGLNIARAYLSDRAVLAVKVDPNSPNKQITILRDERQLTSTITGRASELPSTDKFVTTEIFQQVFRGTAQPYLNQIETTTSYQHSIDSTPAIEADQMTAIYLSPQDPNYFKAGETPVALYRYRLEFFPPDTQDSAN